MLYFPLTVKNGSFQQMPYGSHASGVCLVVLLSAWSVGQFQISNNTIHENNNSLTPSVNLWTCVNSHFMKPSGVQLAILFTAYSRILGWQVTTLESLLLLYIIQSKWMSVQYFHFWLLSEAPMPYYQIFFWFTCERSQVGLLFIKKMLTHVHLFLLSWWARPHF